MCRILLRAVLCAAAQLFALTCACWPSACAQEPVAPGLHDLVIYDPGVHERGLPAPEFVPGGDGGLTIDIPPAVHVHRYYYSGDKEYQGPIISGGPTVVVASHPKTGERMYIDVVLPAGAPRIAYNHHGITYVYPHKRVAVEFQKFPFNTQKAVVKYHGGQGVGRKLHQIHKHVVTHTKTHFQQSELMQSVKESAHKSGDMVKGVAHATGKLTSQLLGGVGSLVDALPGVAPLKSLADEAPYDKKNAEIRGADLAKRHTETQFVPTNR